MFTALSFGRTSRWGLRVARHLTPFWAWFRLRSRTESIRLVCWEAHGFFTGALFGHCFSQFTVLIHRILMQMFAPQVSPHRSCPSEFEVTRIDMATCWVQHHIDRTSRVKKSDLDKYRWVSHSSTVLRAPADSAHSRACSSILRRERVLGILVSMSKCGSIYLEHAA